jgi:hypothetical protein
LELKSKQFQPIRIMVIKITEGTLLRFNSKEVGNAGIEGFL